MTSKKSEKSDKKEEKKFWGLVRNLLLFAFSAITLAAAIYVGITSPSQDSWWQAGTMVLLVAITATIAPILWSFLVFTDLFPSGEWFESSEELSEYRSRLVSHYSRITGTLRFWKSKAAAHQRLYNAQVIWATLSGVALPVLVQYFDKITYWPTLFLTDKVSFI